MSSAISDGAGWHTTATTAVHPAPGASTRLPAPSNPSGVVSGAPTAVAVA